MQHVSSNSTLFLKIFLPTFWLVFFGLFTLAVLIVNTPYFGNIPAFLFRVGVVLFYLAGAAVLYFTVLRLKRVEMDESFVFATNYFKSYRYPWHNIEQVDVRDLFVLDLVTLRLKQGGSFGRKIHFLASKKRFQSFVEAHPDLFAGKIS